MKVEYIPIITRAKSEKIKTSDVIMIERENRKVKVVTDDKKEYVLYGKLDNIKPFLDDRFYPCMAGCLINLDKVRSMEKMVIRFEGGKDLMVGRDNFIRTRQVFNARIRKMPFEA